MATRRPYNPKPCNTDANSDHLASQKKVGIEEHALVSLALHAPQETLELVYRQTRRAVKRLGLGKGDVFAQTESTGTYPVLMDIMRWLDGIKPKLKNWRKDRIFLANLNTTIEGRLPPSVIKKIDDEERS